jgi:hypothetical protein
MSTPASQSLSDTQGDNLGVRMFGCKVDGVTDDTANFQLAVNACAARGTPLMIPGDAPLLLGAHTLPSGLILRGRAGARIVNNMALPGAWMTHSAGSKLRIEGISFDGGRVRFGLGMYLASTAYTIGQGIIDGNGNWQKCTTAGTSGVAAPTWSAIAGHTTADGSGSLVWTMQATSLASAHILAMTGVSDVLIKDCQFTNAVQSCITGYGWTRVAIQGGYFSNWAQFNDGAAAIAAFAQQGGAITDLKISGPMTIDCKTGGGCGIKLQGCVNTSIVPGYSNYPISHVYVGGGVRIIGDASNPLPNTLGIEIWTPTPGGFSDFLFDGIDVSGMAFGISLGAAGNNGTCSNFSIDNCLQIGLESIASNVVLGPGVITNCPDGINISANYANMKNVTLNGIAVIGSTTQPIAIYAGGNEGDNTTWWYAGPFSIDNLQINGCTVDGVALGSGYGGIELQTGTPGWSAVDADVSGITSGATSMKVVALPAGVGPGSCPLFVVLDSGLGTQETVLVTNMSGTGNLTWTITRAAAGTTAHAHSTGFAVDHLAATISNVGINGGIVRGSGVSGSTGLLVTSASLGGISYVTAIGVTFDQLAIGIAAYADSYGRYLWNTFTAAVGTKTSINFTATDVVMTASTTTSYPSITIGSNTISTLPANGDVQLPTQYNAYLTGQDSLTLPNIIALNDANFSSQTQGGFLSVNSRFAGFPHWAQTSTNAWTRAMFMLLGAARFGIGFGPATNTGGATPWDVFPIEVDDGGVGVATVKLLNALIAGKFGCNGKPVQAAAASGGAAVATGSTLVTPYGYTTAAQADGIVTLLNTIRAALVANGIMS